MNEITAAWRGQAPLWKVFWVHYWAIGSGISVAAMALAPRLPPFLQKALLALLLVWGVWVSVSMWRCAGNTTERIFGYLARAYTVLSWLGAGAFIYILFNAEDLFRLPR